MQLISLKSESITLNIKTKGAELVSVKNTSGHEFMWSADPAFWNRTAPHLFPIVGRLKQDLFEFKGKSYTLTQHGFARDSEFKVERQNESSVTFLLRSTEETLQKYPFAFEFRVRYELQEKQLTVSYEVTNTSDSELPYNVGGHPAFVLDHPLEEYALEFEQELHAERWLLDGGHFTGKTQSMRIKQKLPLSEALFEDDAVVFKNPQFHQVTLVHQTAGALLSVRSSNWEAIGFWKKVQAPFLCIEPWWGYADYTDSNGDLFNKKGVHLLKPGQHEEFSYDLLFILD